MPIHYQQQNKVLDEIQEEVGQAEDKIYLYSLLQKIESNSREWIFHQVQNKLTLEQHESLIKRKHDLMEFIRNQLKELI